MAVAGTLYTPNNAVVLEEDSRENLHRLPVSMWPADCSAVMSIILLYSEVLIPPSAENMSEKR